MTDGVDGYHKAFYYSRLWDQVERFGHKCLEHPNDLWIYQELVGRIRPDAIVETGTAFGGTALYLAHLADILGKGHVYSIDNDPQPNLPSHDRVSYITASSTDPSVFATVEEATGGGTALVILDSLPTRDHVLKELLLWSNLVILDSYLIVEDTNINGHPVFTDREVEQGPGPFEATQEFLALDDRFEPDPACEKFLMTLNPDGYLKRVGQRWLPHDYTTPSRTMPATTRNESTAAPAMVTRWRIRGSPGAASPIAACWVARLSQISTSPTVHRCRQVSSTPTAGAPCG